MSSGNPILSSSGVRGILDTYNPSSSSVTVDRTSGVNGEKAYVTVQVKSQGTLFEGEIITVASTLGGATHHMPIWIGN